MIVFNRATFESPQFGLADDETDHDPTGCLAEARFALDDALAMIGNYTCRILGNVTELESAKNYIRRAMSALPGGEQPPCDPRSKP